MYLCKVSEVFAQLQNCPNGFIWSQKVPLRTKVSFPVNPTSSCQLQNCSLNFSSWAGVVTLWCQLRRHFSRPRSRGKRENSIATGGVAVESLRSHAESAAHWLRTLASRWKAESSLTSSIERHAPVTIRGRFPLDFWFNFWSIGYIEWADTVRIETDCRISSGEKRRSVRLKWN